MVLSLAIFVFAKPLYIDRTALFTDIEYQLVDDGNSQTSSNLNSKLKLLMKPKYTPPTVSTVDYQFYNREKYFSRKIGEDIFHPPQNSLFS
jgi:hypothetical protein